MLTDRVVLVSGDAPHVMRDLGAGLSTLGANGIVGELPAGIGLDALVHVVVGAGVTQMFDAIAEIAWEVTAEQPLARALLAGVDAFEKFEGRGGSIVFVTSADALVGASGNVAMATVSEGVRALAKSMARQWGSFGVRVNCVAIGGASLEKLALGRPPSIAGDVAPVVALLVDDAAHFVTGQTIVVDGGVVMQP